MIRKNRAEQNLQRLLKQVRACRECEAHLPLEPRPIVRASTTSRIIIVGQAPGTKVHATGIPWNDPSGDRLRAWMDISREDFYDEANIAIIPMGFCYPGKAERGDAPPRPECALLWHEKLFANIPENKLTVVIGAFAHKYYLEKRGKTLANTVKNWRDYSPDFFPLPHPSPRNILWFKKNSWFDHEVVPEFRRCVKNILQK